MPCRKERRKRKVLELSPWRSMLPLTSEISDTLRHGCAARDVRLGYALPEREKERKILGLSHWYGLSPVR
jgi:hypothetical protein